MTNEQDRASNPVRPPSDDTLPTHNIKDLLGTSLEAILVHGRDRHRVRITANNKLIMTK